MVVVIGVLTSRIELSSSLRVRSELVSSVGPKLPWASEIPQPRADTFTVPVGKGHV